ncbi:MAG: LptF/LptG family permease [Fimbriimonadaceae bacterium]|nr:LptF/LptG family permease [Fimbriimonadaceae bacterium]
MSRLDRLVLGEIVGLWVFGVLIFTVLVTAGSFLFQLTEYIAKGSSPFQVAGLAGLLLPGIMAKTFPMAVLLAALLSFGRLSGDSEIVAIKAAGFSVPRLVLPVGLFGIVVAGAAFVFGELVVPWSARQALEIRKEMDRELQGTTLQPTSRPIFENGKLRAFVVARDFSFARRALSGVVIAVYGDDDKVSFFLDAEELVYNDEQDWRINGSAKLVPGDGGAVVTFVDGVWPREVPRFSATPSDILAQTLRDLDALAMSEMGRQIHRERENPSKDPGQLANLEFGYWNKVAVPLGALVFGLVGAPLGIRNHRSGAATGFWLSVVIIFGYMMIVNLMAILAQGGLFPAYIASFTPTVVGLGVAVFLIYRRNR